MAGVGGELVKRAAHPAQFRRVGASALLQTAQGAGGGGGVVQRRHRGLSFVGACGRAHPPLLGWAPVDELLGGSVRLFALASVLAGLVERELLGRDVVPGMWTYQLVEASDRTYSRVFTDVEEQVRQGLAASRKQARPERSAWRDLAGCSARCSRTPAPG